MGLINILDTQTANLIAAGEVVDRPASALKELTENAIDSGASAITVEIKNGGVSFIRVSDNGCGIAHEDVPTSILRHATSKINKPSDLNAIGTLGFRGEALAAIASVSKLRIMTKTAEEELGTLLRAENGEVIELTDAGCQNGTTVIVEELFVNVPARRKFLKKDAAETMASAAVVEKLAISHPHIAFRFITDGTLRFNTAGDGNLYNTLYTVLGRDFTKRLLKIDFMTGGIEITGYVGQPDNVRSNRNFQNFFINCRYVKCRTASAALEEAFSSYIPPEKFPTCVLNIGILPTFVDVNVHPAKLEVKFSNERLVFDAVYCAVRNALTAHIERPQLMVPSFYTADDARTINAFVPVNDRYNNDDNDKNETLPLVPVDIDQPKKTPLQPLTDGKKTAIPDRRADFPKDSSPEKLNFDLGFISSEDLTERTEEQSGIDEASIRQDNNSSQTRDTQTVTDEYHSIADDVIFTPPKEAIVEPANEISSFDFKSEQLTGSNAAVTAKQTEDNNLSPPYRLIGEAFNSYVIVEAGDRIIVIDKHAAHERIIFEAMKRNKASGRANAQIMLLPYEINLSAAEYAAVVEYSNDIRSCGFDFTLDEATRTLSMLQYPDELDASSASDMLIGLAGKLADNSGSVYTERNVMYESALYQASCKAAIKAGRIYDPGHIQWLCDRVMEMPDIKFCPHGRPIAFELSKANLERQFKRS